MTRKILCYVSTEETKIIRMWCKLMKTKRGTGRSRKLVSAIPQGKE